MKGAAGTAWGRRTSEPLTLAVQVGGGAVGLVNRLKGSD